MRLRRGILVLLTAIMMGQLVFGEEDVGAPVELPLVLYSECENVPKMPYNASGWMGNTGAIEVDDCWRENPHSGKSCMRIDVMMSGMWAGVAWLNPQDDWGDLPGGYDLSEAKKLTFWARGEEGGEKVVFKAAILHDEKNYPDSAREEVEEVKLKDRWKKYKMYLHGDKSRIKNGFTWVVPDADEDVTFYLDDVQYE